MTRVLGEAGRLEVAAWPACGGPPRPDLPLLSRLELGALPGAVPCARLHTRRVLAERGAGRLAETAELLVSELVTNAVRASQAMGELLAVRLRLRGGAARVLIEVWDRVPEPPRPRQTSPASEDGRGLLLVQALSEDLGWYEPEGWAGKAVWCLIGAAGEAGAGRGL